MNLILGTCNVCDNRNPHQPVVIKVRSCSYDRYQKSLEKLLSVASFTSEYISEYLRDYAEGISSLGSSCNGSSHICEDYEYISFQALPYVALLIVLLFFIYAVIGMQVPFWNSFKKEYWISMTTYKPRDIKDQNMILVGDDAMVRDAAAVL